MSIDLRPGAAALESPKAVPGAETVASHWLAVSSALTQTQAVQNASIPPEAWTGAAADAASNEIQVLGHKLADLAEVFPDPAQGLKTWKSQVDQAIQVISGLQQQWDEAVATYNKAIAAISSRRMTEDNFHPEIEEKKARATLEGAQRPLKKSYEDQLHQLNEAASQKADSIKAAADSKISPEAVKRGRDAVGAELLGTDMPIADGAASWADAQAVAPQMVAELEQAANSKGALSEEDVKKLEERWGDKLQNPYYVQAMADAYRGTHQGAGDYSDMLNRLAIKTAGWGANSENSAATRNSFVNRIGTAMVLSTGGVDASEHHLADSAVYEKVKRALRGHDGVTTIADIEHANIESFKETGNRDYAGKPGAAKIHGYQVFTQATAYAGIKNPNLTFGSEVYQGGQSSLAAKIVDYDHGLVPAANGMRYGAPGSFSLINETHDETSTRNLVRDPLQSLYQLSDTPDTIKSPSISPELYSSESARLNSLRDFLNADTGYRVGLPSDKGRGLMTYARYLTGNRHSTDASQIGELDAGEALGDMLHDASDPQGVRESEPQRENYSDDGAYQSAHDHWVEEDRRRAAVAANVMAGYQDGLDYEHKLGTADADNVRGQDVFGLRNHALRSWMGSIISPYVRGLAFDMSHNIPQDQVAQGILADTTGRPTIAFSHDMIARFKAGGGLLQDLAFDQPEVVNGGDPDNPFDDQYKGSRPPALKAIEAAAYKEYMSDVREGLRNSDVKGREDKLNGAIDLWSELIQETHEARADRDVAIAKWTDEDNKRIRAASDSAASVLSINPFLKPIVSWAQSTGADAYFPVDNAQKVWEPRHNAENDSALGLMKRGMVQAMYESGYWTEDGGKAPTSPGGGMLARKYIQDGSVLTPYSDLSSDERSALMRYFQSGSSDFHGAMDHLDQTHIMTRVEGASQKPSGK